MPTTKETRARLIIFGGLISTLIGGYILAATEKKRKIYMKHLRITRLVSFFYQVHNSSNREKYWNEFENYLSEIRVKNIFNPTQDSILMCLCVLYKRLISSTHNNPNKVKDVARQMNQVMDSLLVEYNQPLLHTAETFVVGGIVALGSGLYMNKYLK